MAKYEIRINQTVIDGKTEYNVTNLSEKTISPEVIDHVWYFAKTLGDLVSDEHNRNPDGLEMNIKFNIP